MNKPMEWISVKDRLPVTEYESKPVLVITDHPKGSIYYHVAQYYGDDAWASDSEILHGVTHWQPLPEPPKP